MVGRLRLRKARDNKNPTLKYLFGKITTIFATKIKEYLPTKEHLYIAKPPKKIKGKSLYLIRTSIL
jgi:hypothetical protein